MKTGYHKVTSSLVKYLLIGSCAIAPNISILTNGEGESSKKASAVIRELPDYLFVWVYSYQVRFLMQYLLDTCVISDFIKIVQIN